MNAGRGTTPKLTTNTHQYPRMGRNGIFEVQRARRQFVFIGAYSWFGDRVEGIVV